MNDAQILKLCIALAVTALICWRIVVFIETVRGHA